MHSDKIIKELVKCLGWQFSSLYLKNVILYCKPGPESIDLGIAFESLAGLEFKDKTRSRRIGLAPNIDEARFELVLDSKKLDKLCVQVQPNEPWNIWLDKEGNIIQAIHHSKLNPQNFLIEFASGRMIRFGIDEHEPGIVMCPSFNKFLADPDSYFETSVDEFEVFK